MSYFVHSTPTFFCVVQTRRDASPRFRCVCARSAGDGVPWPHGIWSECARAGGSGRLCLWKNNTAGRYHGGPRWKRYCKTEKIALVHSSPNPLFPFLCCTSQAWWLSVTLLRLWTRWLGCWPQWLEPGWMRPGNTLCQSQPLTGWRWPVKLTVCRWESNSEGCFHKG